MNTIVFRERNHLYNVEERRFIECAGAFCKRPECRALAHRHAVYALRFVRRQACSYMVTVTKLRTLQDADRAYEIILSRLRKIDKRIQACMVVEDHQSGLRHIHIGVLAPRAIPLARGSEITAQLADKSLSTERTVTHLSEGDENKFEEYILKNAEDPLSSHYLRHFYLNNGRLLRRQTQGLHRSFRLATRGKRAVARAEYKRAAAYGCLALLIGADKATVLTERLLSARQIQILVVAYRKNREALFTYAEVAGSGSVHPRPVAGDKGVDQGQRSPKKDNPLVSFVGKTWELLQREYCNASAFFHLGGKKQ